MMTPTTTFDADPAPDADEAAVAVCTILEARTGCRACYRIERGMVLIYLF